MRDRLVFLVVALSLFTFGCKVKVQSIEFDITSKTFEIGQEVQINATVLPADATDKTLMWSSSNVGVATVDNGKVVAIGVGDAIIDAKSASNPSVRCEFSAKVVEKLIPVESVSIDKGDTTLSKGGSLKITGTVLPLDATDKSLKWSSSNIKVATVDGDGNVTVLDSGKTKISATSVADNSKKAEMILTVSYTLSANDITISAITSTGYKYKIFATEQQFLDLVSNFFLEKPNPALTVANVTVKTVRKVATCFLTTELTNGAVMPANFLGVEKSKAGVAASTYSKEFDFVLTVKGEDIVWTYKPSASDTFTLPAVGGVLFDSSQITITPDITTAVITFSNFKQKIASSVGGSETGAGTIAISVKNGGVEIGNLATQTLSDSFSLNLIGLTANTAYNLTFDITLSLTSGANPSVSCDVKNFTTSAMAVDLDVNPLHLSIARKTSERGVPEAKATVLLNFGAELEYLFKTTLNTQYGDYNFDNAIWGGDIVDKNTSVVLATIADAPYKTRVEFNLSLSQDYNLQLKNGYVKVPEIANPSTYKRFNLTWGTTKFWGDSILVKKDKEFDEVIYFKTDYTKSDTPTAKKYTLVFGDDFNYHFNGLNYKSYSAYNDVKDSESLDKEAYLYNRYWDPEGDAPYSRKDISSWDLRNTETKNSILLSKAMAQDVDAKKIYLGHNKTKAVEGYTDLRKGSNGQSLSGLTGCTRSKTVRFGYVEMKVRVKKKAHNSSSVPGPWYAAWLHGDMHEYDIMEFLGSATNNCEQVIHWHNGWTSFGPNPGSTWVGYNVPADYENEWWTYGLYWDEGKVVYTMNGKKFNEMTARAGAGQDNYGIDQVLSNGAWAKQNASGRNVGDRASTYNKDIRPQIAGGDTPIDYLPKRLKGIMDVPMNIFASVELASGGWGGTFSANFNALPTWLEVDYIAYYLPDASLTGLTLTAPSISDMVVGDTRALSLAYVPSHTTEKGVTWSSTNNGVATVNADGVVTASGAGTADIKATSTVNGSIVSNIITVKVVSSKIDVLNVTLDNSSAAMVIGGANLTLTATVTPPNATNPGVTWKTSDSAIATVAGGVVTAKATGSVIITVESVDNPTKKATCNITITRNKVSAPATVNLATDTYNLVKAFDFEVADTDVAHPDFTRDDGLIKVTAPGTKTKLTIAFSNLTTTYDYAQIRMKYGYSGVNTYINTNGYFYTFCRSTGWVWTTSNWGDGTRADTHWGYNSNWNDYGLYNQSGPTIYYFNGANAITTNNGAATGFSSTFDLILEESSSGNVGSHEIEYVAFYKKVVAPPSPSAPATITRDGVNYNLVKEVPFDNDSDSTVDASINSYVTKKSASGVISVNYSLSSSGEGKITVNAGTTDWTYVEIKGKITSTNVQKSKCYLSLFGNWAIMMFRNTHNGTPGEGIAHRVGANKAPSILNIPSATYNLYGYRIGKASHEFFYNSSKTAIAPNTDGQIISAGVSSFDLYFNFNENFAGKVDATFDIEYVAFYK